MLINDYWCSTIVRGWSFLHDFLSFYLSLSKKTRVRKKIKNAVIQLLFEIFLYLLFLYFPFKAEDDTKEWEMFDITKLVSSKCFIFAVIKNMQVPLVKLTLTLLKRETDFIFLRISIIIL